MDHPKRRRHRRDRHRSGDPAAADGAEPLRAPRRRSTETPEQRAYRQAQRRVNVKISFYTHLIAYGSVLTLILVTTRSFRVAMIVATAWGIGLAIHYFVAMVAPSLRQRMIDEEVGKRVHRDLSRERRAIETRHVRSMEDLSASIAHEIRNPITAAKSLVQQMGEDPVSGENIEYAKVALGELDRVEKSISHLLRFARDEALRKDVFSMEEVITSAVETFRERIARAGIELHQEIDTPGTVRGDKEKLRRVVINLVANAIDALEQGATENPRLELTAGENLAGTEIWVRIRDNGPGIGNETLGQIFNPFYTTKEDGTGLGLALSKKVVDAHGGTIEAQSAPGATEFVLTFPKQPENGGDVR